MKVLSIKTITFVLLLSLAAFAQEKNVGQPTESNTPCPDFSMIVVKPEIDENKPPIVKPESKIDFKLIIVDPCVSTTKQSSKSLFSFVPKDDDGLQKPPSRFNFSENIYKATIINPVSTLQPPKE